MGVFKVHEAAMRLRIFDANLWKTWILNRCERRIKRLIVI
jgi:hypothetical protein